jgi:hypothetical protein
MKIICFFNDGHNGDIVHSKKFVQDISNQLDFTCVYSHRKNIKLTRDLNIKTTQIFPSLKKEHYFEKFVLTENIFFISTWMYPYLMDINFQVNGINIDINYKAYSYICQQINETLGTQIQLKEIDYYLPFIDFKFIQKENVDNFILNNNNKKVLLCNGPCLSGQTKYNEDMSDFICDMATKYPNIIFIATQKFDSDLDNIKFTSDIIQINDCDLNEIGYLSTFCDLIIGRNSGPFCFCTIDQNLLDSNKIFYAFGHNERDCFHYGANINAKFLFDKSENKESICESMDKIIVDNLV